YKGYAGLMSGDIKDMDARAVSDIVNKGGTELFSARCLEFKEEAGVLRGVEACKKAGIDGIVVIGGDGSFRGARDLSLHGIPCVGVPATIDNDIASTEYTIGYDTAMNTVADLIDKLRDTCRSHARCSVVEVMGRHAGHLALETGLGCGAIAVLVPELKQDPDIEVIEKIKTVRATGKEHFIVVVAEGVGGSVELAKKIEAETGIETRATIIGHTQRGGAPTIRDRVMATKMADYAVDLLANGIGNRVVTCNNNIIGDKDIFEALQMTKDLDMALFDMAERLAI
ncbi:MAG: ATP-dependent 6-phosphofructokinase, partial [Clostridia bacterium]|nr:ATP-dependent 6-phosphofructokinase [Clostridia bacterium]